jgi:hypothetical protein
MEYEYRRLNWQYIPQISRLEQELFPPAFHHKWRGYVKILWNGGLDKHLFGCFVEDELIGFAVMIKKTDIAWECERLAVRNEHGGVVLKLLELMIRETSQGERLIVQARPCSSLGLAVNPRLIKRFGGCIVGQGDGEVIGGEQLIRVVYEYSKAGESNL